MPPPVTRRSASPLGSPPSPACSYDPRLWDVNSPSELCRRRDSRISVTSPALERFVIQAAALTSPLGRRLYEREIDILAPIFHTSVDFSRVRIVEAVIANAPTTLGNQIRVNPGMSLDTEEGKSTLVHEIAHVWQYQTRGSEYITDSLYHQIRAKIGFGSRNAAYFNYRLERTRNIFEYPAEEQATIIEDYYQLTVRYARDSHPPDWVPQRLPDLPLYETRIAEVRQTKPLMETTIYGRSLMNVPSFDFSDSGDRDRQMTPVVPVLRITF